MKKSLLTFLVLLVATSSFGQIWLNAGNALQRQTNGTYSNYRFNLGSPGFMYFYNKTQTDSLFNIAIGSGVTSFNTRTGAVTLLSADVTTALGFTPVPTTRQIINGYGVLGGGTLATDRTLVVDTTVIVGKPNLASQMALKVPTSRTVAGFPLTTDVILAYLNNGYGILGGSYNGSAPIVNRVDSTVVVSKPNLASQMALKANQANRSINTTVAGLRAMTSPTTDAIYQTSDYGGGQWYYDATDAASADNTGTVIVSSNGKRYKRIFDGNIIYADWFGADPTGINDSYVAIQAAINYFGTNKGTVLLGVGTYFLNSSIAGGFKLPISSNGIRILGQGKATVVRQSRNVPRLFDLVSVNSTTTVLYKNIEIGNFTLDYNNINASVMAAPTAVITGGTAVSTSPIDVVFTSNSGFLPSGQIYFPLTNTGNTKGLARAFQKKAGSTTTIQVFLNSGETIAAGDTVKGHMYAARIIGNEFGIGTASTIPKYNINTDSVYVHDINVTNAPPAEANAGYTSPLVATIAATNTYGILIQLVNAADLGVSGGYSGALYSKNTRIERVSIPGGFCGFAIAGAGSSFTNPNLYFIDNVSIIDTYHDTGLKPTSQYAGYNYVIGNLGYVNNVFIQRATGKNSGDVGIEIDNAINAIVKDCNVENSFGSGYFSTNYNYPATSISGTPTTTLNGAITNSATTLIATSVPTTISKKGYLTIGNSELVSYTLAYGSNTITIARGYNNTAGIAHSNGETIRFFEGDKQNIYYSNCTYNNNQLANGAGSGWLQGRNFILPMPQLHISNSSYTRNSADLGVANALGDAISIRSYNPVIDINGFTASTKGIVHTTSDAARATTFGFANYDSGLAGVNSPVSKVTLKNIVTEADGVLDNGASNNSSYSNVFFASGNYALDFSGLNFKQYFQNINIAQLYGIHFGFNTSYFSGNINGFKFNTSGDSTPTGIYGFSTPVFGKLVLDNLDYSELGQNVTATNNSYRPYSFASATANNVFVGKVKTPNTLTTPAASSPGHRVVVTANYTASFDDEYIAVTTVPITVTLPTVNTGTSAVKVNYGVNLTISDEAYTAATNNITITPASGEKINNSTSSIIINTNGGGYTLKAVPNGWIATPINTQAVNTSNPIYTGTLTGGAANLSGNITASSATLGGLTVTGNVSAGGYGINRASNVLSNPVIWQTNAVSDWFLGSSPTGLATSDLSLYNYGTGSTVATFSKANGNLTLIGTLTVPTLNSTSLTPLQAVFSGSGGNLVSNAILGTGSVVMSSAIAGFGPGTVTSVSSANSDIAVSSPTTTPVLTLNNVNGVTKSYYDPTSSIQTQLNSKAPSASPTFTGVITASAANFSSDVTATTATAVSNSTLVATTNYVDLATYYSRDNTVLTSTNYTVTSSSWTLGKNSTLTIFVDATAGAITITTLLPNDGSALGRTINVVKTDASANAITITSVVGSSTLTTQYQSRTLKSNGTDWYNF